MNANWEWHSIREVAYQMYQSDRRFRVQQDIQKKLKNLQKRLRRSKTKVERERIKMVKQRYRAELVAQKLSED